MNTYSFLVRGLSSNSRVQRVKETGSNFKEALDKLVARFPDKFINFKFARNMDLITARKEALDKSAKTKGTAFYIKVTDDGECEVSSTPTHLDVAAFKNGGEIALESDVADAPKNEPKSPKKGKKKLTAEEAAKRPNLRSKRTGKKLSEEDNKVDVKQKPSKTMAKKKATKKVAAKKVAAPVNKNEIAKPTTLRLTKSQWDNLFKVREKEGKSIQILASEALVKQFKL